MIKSGISSKIDDSGTSIGRRYARTDECGIPFAITVDFETLTDRTVTIRELQSMKQVRMKIEDLARNLYELSVGNKNWQEILDEYPNFISSAAVEEENKSSAEPK